jgi:protein SCO1/2
MKKWTIQKSFCLHFSVLNVLVASILAGACSGQAEALSDSTLASISFEQKLNTQVALDLPFRDESGKPVQLGEFLSKKPVLLVLGYYECPMLCTLVLNGMVESLEDMKWSIGKEFDVINVSINPRETPALAAEKKRTYLKRYGRSGAADGWHFLTGEEVAIQRLADEVGFQYSYDAASKQYAHPSGLVILTPQGKVAGYLFGVTYSPKDLFAALQRASANQISSPIRKLVLLCFHYNPITGKYGAMIMTLVRICSAATVIGLLWLVTAGARHPKRRQVLDCASPLALSHTSAPEHSSLCDSENAKRRRTGAVQDAIATDASTPGVEKDSA